MMNPKDISAKAYIVFIGLSLVGIAIVVRVFALQMFPSKEATDIAQNFTYKVMDIQPTRGQIISSDGSLLATSVPEFEIRWDSKASYPDSVFRKSLDSLALRMHQVFGKKSKEEYKQLFKRIKAEGKRYEKIIDHIDYNQLQLFKNFPFARLGKNKSGFIVIQKDKRKKPFGNLAARTIGLEREENKVGIELAFDSILSGVTGKQLQEKVAGGIWMPMTDEFIVEPEPGADVITTIDIHLQDVASAALERKLKESEALWGCVILMEVETGYVRAIANLGRDSVGRYSEKLNYAISQSIEPGSTMKLASLMACLDDGLIELDDTVNTGNGITYFYKKRMRDSNWDKGGHGVITAEESFEYSSNIGTALLVKRSYTGKQKAFTDKLKSFGLDQPLGIALRGEGKPVMYTPDDKKMWSGISITQMAIGYEYQCTPLQTLALYNAVANNGDLVRPLFVQQIKKNGRIVKTFEPEIIREDIVKPETIKQCRQMMEGVMQKGGTADKVFEKSPYTVGGKTGTCWLNEEGEYQSGRYRASFVGYFPADKPKYSCIVVVHDPSNGIYYGSAIAAPVFKELADKIYSTEIDFHSTPAVVDSALLAGRRIPISKNGSAKELQIVYKGLNIPNDFNASSPWVSTTSEKEKVTVADRNIAPGLVPNVVGMGLQDALYLLENQGMYVRVVGSGEVKRQSIPPGSNVKNNNSITIELQ